MSFEVDVVGVLAREVLRERTAELVAEACAWAVGLSDRQHHARRHGRVVPTGVTLGMRGGSGVPVSGEEDARLELGEARPGTFRDVLGALTADGRLVADLLDEQVLAPFVLDTCVRALERARRTHPEVWAEVLDDAGDDGSDLPGVVRAAEWEAPLRTEAEQLMLSALGDLPLVEIEAEGLPLSLVRAAEALTRDSVDTAEPDPAGDELSGAVYLAEAAVAAAGLPRPVPPPLADRLVEVLLEEGLEPDELLPVLARLPVAPGTSERVAALLQSREG